MDLFTVILLVIAVLIIGLIWVFNSLASARVAVQESLSGVEIQMKRRADLVPGLIESVKGYVKHESNVFEEVVKARENMMKASNVKEESAADNMLSGALKSIFALAESYPDLKASTNFSALQSELSDIEAKISYARQFYNNNVKAYNSQIVTFPTNVIANAFGFKNEEFFDAEEGIEKPVEVKF